jgi:recombination protein RecR
MKEKVGLCEVCFNLAEGPRCRICEDPRRDDHGDLRRRGAGRRDPDRAHARVPRPLPRPRGRLSPIDGIDPEDLRIAELLRRAAAAEVEEVVLATNPTTTGEATALHIAEGLRGQVAVTRLATDCRSAPTSSMPTRSPWARRSRAGDPGIGQGR